MAHGTVTMHPVTDVSVHFANEPYGGLAQINAWEGQGERETMFGGETVSIPPQLEQSGQSESADATGTSLA